MPDVSDLRSKYDDLHRRVREVESDVAGVTEHAMPSVMQRAEKLEAHAAASDEKHAKAREEIVRLDTTIKLTGALIVILVPVLTVIAVELWHTVRPSTAMRDAFGETDRTASAPVVDTESRGRWSALTHSTQSR